jgi:hypothetical protein
LPFQLRWDEKGKVKKFGERLAGFVNSVTGGLLDAGDWLMGRDSYVDTTSPDYQEAENAGMVLGIALPLPGTKVKALSKVDDAVKGIKKWLGPGTTVKTNKAGDKIFLSANGKKRIRFDIKRPHPHKNPHGHVDELVNGKWVKSGQIYPKGVPPK